MTSRTPRHIARIRRALQLSVLAALVSTLTPAAALAQLAETPWPMAHADMSHTGRGAVAGPAGATLKWIYSNPDRWACRWTCPTLRNSAAIGADGTIYVGVGFQPLCALDPASGAELWCTEGGGDVNRSSPAVGQDAIYIGARDNKLWAVSPAGSTLWTYKVPTDGDILGAPVVGPDATIYMACQFGAHLHALRPDGTLKWKFRITGASKSISPAIAPDANTIYMATTNGQLHAFSPSGSRKWWMRFGGLNYSSSPAIDPSGMIYIGSSTGLHAIDPTGQRVWTFKTAGRVETTPAIGADGTVYVGTIGKTATLYAIDPVTRQPRWTYRPTGRGEFNAAPAIDANGVVYAPVGAWIVALSPANGNPVWDYKTGANIYASPAIGGDGTLYVSSSDNKLYAFGD